MRRLLLLCAAGLAFAAAPAFAANPQVELETTAGTIKLELYPEAAPKTVENFLKYVNSGHYAGTQFHRVIKGFMIQGGGFSADFTQKPTRPPVRNEGESSTKAGLLNTPGTVAMARTSDPHSASAQFFINVADNTFLNYTEPTSRGYGYTVFGKVVEGMDVVNKIVAVPTGNSGMHQNVPRTPVVIESMTLVQPKK